MKYFYCAILRFLYIVFFRLTNEHIHAFNTTTLLKGNFAIIQSHNPSHFIHFNEKNITLFYYCFATLVFFCFVNQQSSYYGLQSPCAQNRDDCEVLHVTFNDNNLHGGGPCEVEPLSPQITYYMPFLPIELFTPAYVYEH